MISANKFLNILKQHGYNFFTGVACSYLTELINLIEADEQITYVAATNEGDAVATAAGAYLAGHKPVVFMQNSVLGNAVNPITSLLKTFDIPLLFLITHRGDPEQAADQPQHQLMGAIMMQLLSAMQVHYQPLTAGMDDSTTAATITSAIDSVEQQQQSFALIIKKGCFDNKAGTADELDTEPVKHQRHDVLTFIQQQFDPKKSIILATTGYTGRELYALNDSPHQFYMVGSMGCVSSLGLGIALKQPHKKIIVIDGDGAAMMRMGAMATIGHYHPSNLLHILLDNGSYESTGGQTTVADSINFASIARGCGYNSVYSAHDYQPAISEWKQGLRFVYIKTVTHKGKLDYPRPTITPPQVAQRIKKLLTAQELHHEIT